MLPLVTAQTVASERGVGGRIRDEEHFAGKVQRQATACTLRSHRHRLRSDPWFGLIGSLLDLRASEPPH